MLRNGSKTSIHPHNIDFRAPFLGKTKEKGLNPKKPISKTLKILIWVFQRLLKLAKQ